MTTIEGSVALVTGGSRGIGRALVAALYERGAKKVYATARDPHTVTHPDAVPLALEVTDPASVAAAAEQAQDVTLLINNAGASVNANFLDSPVDDVRRDVRHQLEFLERTRALLAGGSLVVVGVVHDLNLAARFADRVVVMAEGRVLADGAPEAVLTPDHVERAFGVRPVVQDVAGRRHLAFG